MKNKKSFKQFLWSSVVMIVLLSSVIVISLSTTNLENVKKVILIDNILYGIDEREDAICLFMSDRNGENAKTSIITTSQIATSPNVFYQLDDFEIVGDGIFKLIGKEIRHSVSRGKQYSILYDLNKELFMEMEQDLKQDLKQDLNQEINQEMNQKNSMYYLEKEIDGNLWYVDNLGNVVKFKSNQVPTVVFLNDGFQISKDNMAHIFSKDGLYFYNISSGKQYMLSYQTGNLEEKSLKKSMSNLNELGYLAYLYEMEDGEITASFYTEEGNLLPAVLGENTKLLEKLVISKSKNLKRIALLSVLLLIMVKLVAFILITFRKLANDRHKAVKLHDLHAEEKNGNFFGKFQIGNNRKANQRNPMFPIEINRKANQRKRMFPTALKLILLSVPLLYLILFLMNLEMEKFHLEEIEKQNIVKIDTLSKLFPAERIKKDFSSLERYLDEIIESIREAEQLELHDKDGVFANFSAGLTNNDLELFKYEDNQFYKIDSTMLYCAPMEHSLQKEEMEALEMVMKQKLPLHRDTLLNQCLVLASYYPITDDNNAIVAILKTSLLQNSKLETPVINKMIIKIMIFMIIMISIMVTLVFFLLKPLSKLRVAIIANSLKGEKKKKRSYSEVGKLKETCKDIFAGIQKKSDDIFILKKAYEPYIPNELFALFNKKDISEISLGDKVCVRTAVLMVDSNNFSRIASKTSSFKTFLFVNKILKELAKAIYEEGGIVSDFKEVSITAFFKEDITAAISSGSKALEGLGKIPLKLRNTNIEFGACVVETEIHMGIIGSEERMEVMVLEECLQFSNCLKKIAAEYKTGVLIDEVTVKKVDKYIERDTVRVFGLLQIKDIGEKLIYEDFSGQAEEQRLLKKMTKKDFESGVKWMIKKDYTKARTYFVKVIKKNKEDIISYKHFQSCNDAMYQNEKGAKNEI